MNLKRYRFTNKERDDETGLYYFGVRYYAAWLGRWTSSDPSDFSFAAPSGCGWVEFVSVC
ncbi:RHS repeat-associated core domain-containing protein [Aureispira anguillae]|uniref:RHS repeat-associated core domain-containing protein n=1 Tax=Aureispira anguillae TaxID=2864201 RepID=UPI0038992EB5